MKKLIFLSLLLSFYGLPVVGSHLMADSDDLLYVGVLENIKPEDQSESSFFACPRVRVAFVKKSGKWSEMPLVGDEKSLKTTNEQYPDSVKWTVVFDGKKLGNIESKKTSKDLPWYSWVGLQKIVSNGVVPQTKIGADNFYYDEGSSKSRPLILTSAPNFSDPDGWKPSKPTPNEEKSAIAEFRKIVPYMINCKSVNDEKAINVPYPDSNLIFSQSYRSKKGVLITDCQLDKYDYKCDGPTPDEILGHWFALWPDGKTKYLGTNIQPMDAADLDKSGESEWVFHCDQENEDGYILYYENFAKSVTFFWNYH